MRIIATIVLSLFSIAANAVTCGTTGLQTKVFTATSGTGQNIEDFEIAVDSGWVVVGGGVDGGFNKKYLTASYPKSDLSAWVVSAKDHITPNSDSITGYAIGLKVTGLTAAQLKSHIKVETRTEYDNYPNVAISATPSGRKLLGGGFKIDWYDWGVLAVSNRPSDSDFAIWGAYGKEHGNSEDADLTGYVISLPGSISGIGSFEHDVNSATSGTGAHVQKTVSVEPGYLLTACGGRSSWTDSPPRGSGQLLYKIKPTVSGTSPTGCDSGAKDLQWSDYDETVTAYAVGLRLCN